MSAHEARRCAAGLRFALLRFTMQRLVAQQLQAIKAHLWRPQGRLAQRQAADALPADQLASMACAQLQHTPQAQEQCSQPSNSDVLLQLGVHGVSSNASKSVATTMAWDRRSEIVATDAGRRHTLPHMM